MTTCPLCATKHDGPCYQEFRPNLNRTQNNVMKTEHKETQEGWGVLVKRKDGKVYLWAKNLMPKDHAQVFCADLAENEFIESADVAKLRATWEVIQ